MKNPAGRLTQRRSFFGLVETDKKGINYTQSYISIVINGRNSYNLDKRTQPTSVLWFNVKDDEKVDAIKMVFDKNNVVYNYNRYNDFVINVDQNMIKNKKSMFQEIMKIRHKDIYGDASRGLEKGL